MGFDSPLGNNNSNVRAKRPGRFSAKDDINNEKNNDLNFMIMKKNLFFAAAALVALASCSENDFVGNNSPDTSQENATDAIQFSLNLKNTTRAGEFIGATAAEKLGGMFVVEGTKGSEQPNSPSTTVVFDNYLVGYEANSAGTQEDNTNNWEYVGLESGITGRMSGETWTALHPDKDADDNPLNNAQSQTIKYWDYSQDQYDFIAWSTGEREAVADAAVSGTKVKVTRINNGATLATDGFTFTALSAADLLQCYYTDINTVTKTSEGYGKPVTLTFKNMAAKVRVALYETVPGYSVKDVYFYTSDANPTTPEDLGVPSTNATAVPTGSETEEQLADLNSKKDKAQSATLFTMGTGVSLPQSGEVLVYYPHIGTAHRDVTTEHPVQTKDYNKASVTVTAVEGGATSTTQTFGALTANYTGKEANEAAGNIYLGRTLPTATFAGSAADNYYQAVIPNTNGVPLTLRVDYTLVSTDGSTEAIHVYGAKAVVPATYTVWQPNYAYTYIFKISDNTNGWTSTTNTDPQNLFPITFDAMVASFTDANAEQTTVTTVATPSITTYQQGHDWAHKDEYSKSQKAGVSTAVKDLYVQVMDNSGATPTLKADLNTEGKSLLFSVSKANASEAEVMDALQNRTNAYDATSPVGRNGITLTTNGNIANDVTQIINGVDDQPITKIAGANITAGQVAKIDIDQLDAGTYAYVYCTTPPSADEKVYHVAAGVTDASSAANYYEVKITDIATTACAANAEAEADKVYFVKNTDATGGSVTYTFKQTKVGDDVEGLYEASIPDNKGTTSYSASNFYFDVYNQNNGAYAVKVIKVVN